MKTALPSVPVRWILLGMLGVSLWCVRLRK